MFTNTRLTDITAWLLAIISIIFGISSLCMILVLAFRYSTVLPFWDQWEFISELVTNKGHYPLANLWLQHGEHRIVLPKLFLLMDFFLFGAKNRFLICCILVLQLLTALLMFAAVSKNDNVDRKYKITLYGLIIFLLFSPVQMDNFVWGFQISFVLATFFAVLSLYLFSKCLSPIQGAERLHGKRHLFFRFSLLAAVCATVSLASGLFIWPVLILAAITRGLEWRRILTLLVTSTLIFVTYFHRYRTPAWHSNPIASLSHPLLILQYLSLYVGGAWVIYGQTAASIVGFAGIAVSLVLLSVSMLRWKTLSSSDIFFLCVILFVLAAGFLTGLGRIKFGIEQGFSSRYQTVALLLWAAACSLIISWLGSKFGKGSSITSVALLIVSLSIWSPFFRVRRIITPYSGRAGQWRVAEAAALTGVADPEMERAVTEDPHHLQPLLDFLEQRSLSVFSRTNGRQMGSRMENLYIIDRTADCTGGLTGSVLQSPLVSDFHVHNGLRLNGWAWDQKGNASLKRLLVVGEDGRVAGFGVGGYPDPNVSQSFSGSPRAMDGWFAYKRQQQFPDRFRIYGVLQDQKHVCAVGQEILKAQALNRYGPDSPGLAVALSKNSNGIFRNGQWWRDTEHNLIKSQETSRIPIFGIKDDLPVVGDWDGNEKTRVGVFRAGQWWLDMNGNGQWDPYVDRLNIFGQKGDIPITGDWDNSGRLRIGVFRDGAWWLDINGNGIYDSGDRVIVFGQRGDRPVVGDWDGSGHLRIGVFRNGDWLLDMNGDLKWEDSVDKIVHFGTKGDLPVIGNWDRIGKLRIGVFRNGRWLVDMNGNNSWDGPDIDREFIFGQPGDLVSVLPWPN